MYSLLLATGGILPLLSFASPVSKRQSFESGPLIATNFPDPSYIQVNGTYYAFSTNSGGSNVPIATSTDFQNWSVVSGADALPTTGSWSDGTNVWAPMVVQVVRFPVCGLYAISLLTNCQPGRRKLCYVLLRRTCFRQQVPLRRHCNSIRGRRSIHSGRGSICLPNLVSFHGGSKP